MKYRVLVIDDDEPIHYLVKNLLGNEFSLSHARNAQEAIDVLSKVNVNLILSDIHMPGLSGLELLESLRSDSEKKDIPVLIMTNLPTVEKEKKALDLGAADFIKKELFNKNKERILELVRMKVVTNVQVQGLEEDLTESKNKLVMHLMESALSGSFEDTVEVILSELLAIMNTEFAGFWVIKDGKPELMDYVGSHKPSDEVLEEVTSSMSMKHLISEKEAYLSNQAYNEKELGFFKEYSKDSNLAAEIAVPLFSISEQGLISNNL
jgi:CheY-like chemotaxis protein